MNTKTKANELRKEVMRVAIANNKGHIAPSLSCLDILTVLYYDVMTPDDICILSKGHGCYGLYAILADKGYIPKRYWHTFNLDGCLRGFGSLGHGLPFAAGVAFGMKLLNVPGHVYCIVGDGELQEGSNWEALAFINHHQLDNLTIIVDDNGLQAMDVTNLVLSANISAQFKGFGIEPIICNGHDHKELPRLLNRHPKAIIAYTIKGKGYKCMEDKAEWHFRVPTAREVANG